jgi:copper chaperone CopZ
MTKQIFKIVGMHCTSCALNIDLDLEEIKGIKSAKTSFAKGTLEVEFEEKLVTYQVISDTVAKTGYQLKTLS